MVLDYYGAEGIDKKYNRIRCTCPIHGGDNKSAFNFDLTTGYWTCYSHGCGERVGRDIFGLIQLGEEKRKINEGINNYRCSFKEALEIAAFLSGVKLIEDTRFPKEEVDKLHNKKWLRQMMRIYRDNTNSKLDKEILNQYQEKTHPYITNRLSDEIIKKYQIGYSEYGIGQENIDDGFPGRVIVPIYNETNDLVGISGRIATDNKELIDRYGKYKHKYDFDRGFVLYNLNNAKTAITEQGFAILCEGFFDVINLDSFGVRNAVGIMGTLLTPDQIILLLKYSYNVYVCMDNDKAGHKATQKIAKQIKNLSNTYIINLPEGQDPGSISEEEFWISFSEAKKYLTTK